MSLLPVEPATSPTLIAPICDARMNPT